MKYNYVPFRHAATAAHCVCSPENSVPKTAYSCRPHMDNQVKEGQNYIFVLGGSKRQSILDQEDAPNTWKITAAYIMKDSAPFTAKSNVHSQAGKYDIGILKSGLKPFFDKHKLTTKTGLGKAKVIPICLPAEKLELKEKVITRVGWGIK